MIRKTPNGCKSKQSIKGFYQLRFILYVEKLGAVIPKPYLFVEHYPIMKDICYQMRERGMTFEEAESRIKEMEDDLHISIARTQIYWNNVISRMANNRTNKNWCFRIL